MKFKSKIGFLLKANMGRFTSFGGGTKHTGRWITENHSPVNVSDPKRVAYEADRAGLFLGPHGTALLSQGLLRKPDATELVSLLSAPIRREVERLFSGGGLRWRDLWHNIVVNEGRSHSLDVTLSGGTQDTTWFIGLLLATPTVLITWTSASLAAEDFVAYDEATLPAFVDGGVTVGSDIATVDNSASTADFSINADTSSIGGGFIITDATKATPAGTLYAAGAFTGGNKAADSGDTLQVTGTFTQSDDGV